MRLCIGFDEGNLCRVAAGERKIVAGFAVDREEAAGRAVFGRHVADGRTVGQRQRADTRAEEFDELADNAFGAQHLRDRQHQIGGGHTFFHLARQLHADDFGQQHRDRLAEHRGLGLDPADTPGQNGQAVDHGGVAVGADDGIGIRHRFAAGIVRHPDGLGQVFKVHLMADTGARRHNTEIIERLRSPAQEFVAFLVPFKFKFNVVVECAGRA